MSEYAFSASERYAVYVTHGERCYICTEPVDLMSTQVDHIVPEHLVDKTEELRGVLEELGLPPTFDLNSYHNWIPSCGRCNNRKRGMVFKSTPLIQIELQRAANKATAAQEVATEAVNSRKIANALNVLARAHERDGLEDDVKLALRPLVVSVLSHRGPEDDARPVMLTPLYRVLSEDSGYRMVQGPYGVGARPSGRPDPSWDCPNCGSLAAWNGTRCVMCGQMDCD